MEGFNWWGTFTFIMPIALAIISMLILIISSILNGINKLIEKVRREIWKS